MKNNYFCKSILVIMLLGFAAVSAIAKDVERFKQLHGIYMLGNVYSVTVSPDSTRLVVANVNGAKLYDLKTCKEITTLNESSFDKEIGWEAINFRVLTFSPDGNYIMAPVGHEIKLWDAKTGKLVRTIVKKSDFPSKKIWEKEWKGDAYVPDTYEETKQVYEEKVIGHPFNAAVFSPDGKYIAGIACLPADKGGWQDSSLRIWEVNSGKEIIIISDIGPGCYDIAYSHDGKKLMIWGHYSIAFCDAKTGKPIAGSKGYFMMPGIVVPFYYENEIADFFPLPRTARQIAFSGNFTWRETKILDVISTDTTYFKEHAPNEPKDFKLFFSDSQGKNVVQVTEEEDKRQKGEWKYFIQIKELKTGKLIASFFEPASRVRPNCVLYSPNGERIVAGFEDGSIRIWNAKTGVEIPAPQFKSGTVSAMEFSSDSRYLIIGSSNGSVTIWG